MEDVYAANAPTEFPAPKEQPKIEELIDMEEKQNAPMKEAVDRWKKEILDKIQYLKENFDQASRDREALSQEIDRLKEELSNSQKRAQVLDKKLAETMETFNNLLDEVSGALRI
jgi:predicted  nucleic acid-binding Zn-ribbon protein